MFYTYNWLSEEIKIRTVFWYLILFARISKPRYTLVCSSPTYTPMFPPGSPGEAKTHTQPHARVKSETQESSPTLRQLTHSRQSSAVA